MVERNAPQSGDDFERRPRRIGVSPGASERTAAAHLEDQEREIHHGEKDEGFRVLQDLS